MIYSRQIRIEFNHCDPAGIVFYPRYFEMTNSVAENFFRDVVRLPYERMIEQREGVPTAHVDVNFHAPSRLGEILDWRLQVTRLGRAALDLHIEAHGAGIHRLTADMTLVHVDAAGRPRVWADETRKHITAFKEAQ